MHHCFVAVDWVIWCFWEKSLHVFIVLLPVKRWSMTSSPLFFFFSKQVISCISYKYFCLWFFFFFYQIDKSTFFLFYCHSWHHQGKSRRVWTFDFITVPVSYILLSVGTPCMRCIHLLFPPFFSCTASFIHCAFSFLNCPRRNSNKAVFFPFDPSAGASLQSLALSGPYKPRACHVNN